MPIQIYNSLTQKKEVFEPLNPPKVSYYSCGPTVYGEFHIGNARTFVMSDVIRRWMLHRGYDVRYVQNITDIDDKIIQKAEETGQKPEEVATKYTNYFLEKLDQLGVLPASEHPRATQFIGPMIGLIKRLVDKGNAYATDDGNVWFHVESFPEYGKLSRMPLDQIRQGERVDESMQKRKKSPLDFALWKTSKEGEPAWKSPWGEGRPGWHIECSCMAMKALGGDTIDLHAGGADLRFPHHENEIAQSEAATGKTFSRYWVHMGMLDVEGEKMAKSLGNFKTLDDVQALVDPLTLRYFLMSARYRDSLDFSESTLHQCESAVRRMTQAQREANRQIGIARTADELIDVDGLNEIAQRFEEAMDDDFNTPRALAEINQLVTEINRELAGEPRKAWLTHALALLGEMRDALGLGKELELPSRELDEETVAQISALVTEVDPVATKAKNANALMQQLIMIREQARKEKNWELADRIRDRLQELGIKLEDRQGETIWSCMD